MKRKGLIVFFCDWDEWDYDDIEMIDHKYGSAERTEIEGEDHYSLNVTLSSCGFRPLQYSAYEFDRALSRKLFLVELKGGKCEECGYNKQVSALDFHHISPELKKFSIGRACLDFSDFAFKELLLPEVDQCRLLCSNCHREEHSNRRRIRRYGKKRASTEGYIA